MEIKIDKQTNNIQDTAAAITGLIRMLENATIEELKGRYAIKVEIRKLKAEHTKHYG